MIRGAILLENNITHDNHYVPQFYLRNWSEDGKQIFVYSLLVPDSRIPCWSLKKIKSTAVWNDFYTRNNGETEIDDFEKWFNSEFETPVQRVIDSLLNGHNLNKHDTKIISRFVAAQNLRTPARLNSLLEQWRTEMPQLINDVIIYKMSYGFKILSELTDGNNFPCPRTR